MISLLVILCAIGTATTAFVTGKRADKRQQVAVPAYFTDDALWTRLADATPTAAIAVMNPNSGPGREMQPDYVVQTQKGKARGVTVIGYVDTQHGKRASRDVYRDIDAYFDWYAVDGIFFDQASTDCAHLSYYTEAHNYVKAKSKTVTTILNPGVFPDECYMTAADIVVTFENSYAKYVADYVPPPWIGHYPSDRFWHLVHDVATVTDMHKAVRLSKNRSAGWIYVTRGEMPNPWGRLPDEPYWAALLEAAGKP